MGRAEVLHGVREMRFEALLDRHERGELNQEEAAEMLGISERTFRRGRDRMRDAGRVGLRDRRIGKPSSRRAAVEEIVRMLGLYEEHYGGVHGEAFSRAWAKRYDYKLGYTVTRLALHEGRAAAPGCLALAWLPGDDRQYDLAVLHHRIPPSRERLLIQIKAPGDQSTIITYAELVGGLRPEGGLWRWDTMSPRQ
jgi:transposase